MELEIKVMWCRGLTMFNFFQKLTVYVVGSINSQDERIQLSSEQKQEQKTHVDEEGDGNPEWNYTMNFNLKSIPISSNLQTFCLLFEIRNHGQLLRDRNIGEVKVPLKDLIESVGFGVVRFASYEITGFDGKSNGILDFSYKVMMNGDLGHYHSDFQISGYNTDHHNNNHHYGHNYDHLGQPGMLNTEKIEYPKLEFEGKDENVHFQNYPPACYEPPGPPMWAPPCPQFLPPPPPPPPPPPRPQPVAYRPPPQYGDPYWGYHRPPPPEHYYYQYSNSSGGYGSHYW